MMDKDRLERLRIDDSEDDLDNLKRRSFNTEVPFLAQIVNGGSMPQGQGTFYFTNPVEVSGNEGEGLSPTLTTNSNIQIPVLVIGSRQVYVGDYLTAFPVGGRWISDSGIALPNCNPQNVKCPQAHYAVNGTVNDPINGNQPMVYDFTRQSWYSPWLKFSSPYVLQTGIGQDPCAIGNGTSYYFYTLSTANSPTKSLVANLFLPGQSCHLTTGALTSAFFSYPGANYPGLLGSPAASGISGFTLVSSGNPSACDPLTYAAAFSGSNTPLTSATFTIPKMALPGYGYTCTTPCPLPRTNLTVSWANTNGNGSATLTYNIATQDWTTTCQNGLKIRLYATGSNTIGFTATLFANSDCTGASSPFSYPTSIGQTAYSCSPFMFTFNVLFNTSALYLAGYRSFTVTQ